MSAQPSRRSPEAMPPALQMAFAPLHKRAFGVAIGCATGLLLMGVTLLHLWRAEPGAGPDLGLLRNYLAGYSVSLPGALVGLLWGGFVGFVAGWFFAFCRNLVLAFSVFLIRARAELNQTRDFLDHI